MLSPDYLVHSVFDIDIDFLKKNNASAVIFDIDNTLEPYENPTPSAPLLAWFDSLANAGIKAAFVSNNNATRVELFNKNLGFPAYFKAGKPFKKKIICRY